MGKTKRNHKVTIDRDDLPKERIPLPKQTEKVMTSRNERRKSSVSKKDRWREED